MTTPHEIKPEIESDFEHAGLRCVVLFTPMGHRCGYVGVPTDHPLHGVGYNDPVPGVSPSDLEGVPMGKRGLIPLLCSDGETVSGDVFFDVHGSLTYSNGSDEYPVPNSKLWWFGFDCSHCDDRKDIETATRYFGAAQAAKAARFTLDSGVVRSQEYVERECQRLAHQLASFAKRSRADSAQGV